jgi:hypothetical protein
MNESKLRETIRKEIRASLKEVDVTTGVERETGKIEKNAGVKMLKRALAQGSPRQQAAGLVKVINAISGGNAAVKNALIMMLKQSNPDVETDSGTDVPSDIPVDETNINPTLASRQSRVDKTQAMQMLKKALQTKPANMQVDYVIGLVNDLGLKDAAKKRLLLKIRQGLQ